MISATVEERCPARRAARAASRDASMLAGGSAAGRAACYPRVQKSSTLETAMPSTTAPSFQVSASPQPPPMQVIDCRAQLRASASGLAQGWTTASEGTILTRRDRSTAFQSVRDERARGGRRLEQSRACRHAGSSRAAKASTASLTAKETPIAARAAARREEAGRGADLMRCTPPASAAAPLDDAGRVQTSLTSTTSPRGRVRR